jgi:ATP-dependent DNA helicase PIF1
MLNEMREGRLSQQSITKFRTLCRALRFEDELDATELFPTRAEVDNANTARMRNLQGDVKEYLARDGGTIADKAMRDRLLQNCMAGERIVLKKGAQVMLIKNIDDTLVNGSLGKVIGFMSEQTFDNYQENEEEYYATQRADEDGPPGLSERKTELIAGTAQLYPVVRFAIADGSTRDLLCQRETWKVELPSGEVQASRSQIPLILAWALSIHKAQGQTLERVKVDLGKVFEKGQAYVALSRATSMAGLQVLRFDPSRVLAHDRVRNFYAGLSRAEAMEKTDEGKIKGKGTSKQAGLSAHSYERDFVADGEGD